MHSDSTFSLLPPPQTLIHPPSSASTFLLLQNPNPNPRVLFIVSGPYKAGSQILLRFYVLHKQTQFVKAQVVCSQKDLNFNKKLGVLVDCSHGVSIKLSGSVNFFAMYSISSSKIWVFAVKEIGGGDEVAVKLMRCAVIDCCKVVWSISVAFGFLILGEDDGVRVLNLRQLVKRKVQKGKGSNSSLKSDGVIGENVHCEAGKCNVTCAGRIMGIMSLQHYHSRSKTMEESPYSSRGRDEPEFSLRDWAVKARGISRENTNSRRFSASYIRSFREDTRSFRSNITISSTASSPGYALREEIDPATYSFTTALKALQARSAYHSWEALSPDGFALHSKWNEAEKYICNPLSGQVPLECLSAKTLSGRSFRNITNRITMSAPLVYTSHTRPIHTTKPSYSSKEDLAFHFPVPEKKNEGMTRDVGTQSTPPDISSSSLSSASTPPIVERSLNRFRGGDSPNSNSNSKPKSEEEDEEDQMEVKDTEEEEETKTVEEEEEEEEERKKTEEQKWRQGGGCLSWMRKRNREKHKPTKKNMFLSRLKGCRK